MTIGAGIDPKEFEKTKRLILKEFDNIKEGNFTESDLEIAKATVVKSLKSVTDGIYGTISFYYNRVLASGEFDVDTYIDKINLATKEDVIKAGKKVILDTVYLLK